MNERSTEPRPDPARDQQTGRLLDEWLRDEAPTHEPPVLMPTVRARIALTRRRPALLIRDWWRWRPGRNDRRFLRMNTATQLAAVAVLALSGLGLYMVADGGPTTDPAPPAAVTTLDPEEVIAKVTGSMTGSPGPDTVEIGQYAFEHRGMTATGLVIADDPRFDGQVEMAFEWDDFLPQAAFGAATKSFTIHVETEEGAWDGLLLGIRYPEETYGHSHTAGLLTGSGAYEGLSTYLFLDGDSLSFEGLIFPGGMPE